MSREAKVGIGTVAFAIAALAVDFFLGGLDLDKVGADADDVAGFVVGSILAVAVAAWVFGRLIPRSLSSGDGGNRAARAGLVTSIVAAVTVVIMPWLGFPYVLAPSGLFLGWIGYERVPDEGRRGMAVAAVVIGVIALLFATFTLFSDVF